MSFCKMIAEYGPYRVIAECLGQEGTFPSTIQQYFVEGPRGQVSVWWDKAPQGDRANSLLVRAMEELGEGPPEVVARWPQGSDTEAALKRCLNEGVVPCYKALGHSGLSWRNVFVLLSPFETANVPARRERAEALLKEERRRLGEEEVGRWFEGKSVDVITLAEANKTLGASVLPLTTSTAKYFAVSRRMTGRGNTTLVVVRLSLDNDDVVVRCPDQLMGAVIGAQGANIKNLERKIDKKIRLQKVEVSSSEWWVRVPNL